MSRLQMEGSIFRTFAGDGSTFLLVVHVQPVIALLQQQCFGS